MWLTSSGQWEGEGGESDAEWYWWVLHVVDSWCAVSCEVCSIADLDPCRWTRRQPDWNRVNTVRRTVTLCHNRTTSVDLGIASAQRRLQVHYLETNKTCSKKQTHKSGVTETISTVGLSLSNSCWCSIFIHLQAIRRTIYISLSCNRHCPVWRVHGQRGGNWLQLQINNELKLVRWGSRAAWPHRYICQY